MFDWLFGRPASRKQKEAERKSGPTPLPPNIARGGNPPRPNPALAKRPRQKSETIHPSCSDKPTNPVPPSGGSNVSCRGACFSDLKKNVDETGGDGQPIKAVSAPNEWQLPECEQANVEIENVGADPYFGLHISRDPVNGGMCVKNLTDGPVEVPAQIFAEYVDTAGAPVCTPPLVIQDAVGDIIDAMEEQSQHAPVDYQQMALDAALEADHWRAVAMRTGPEGFGVDKFRQEIAKLQTHIEQLKGGLCDVRFILTHHSNASRDVLASKIRRAQTRIDAVLKEVE